MVNAVLIACSVRKPGVYAIVRTRNVAGGHGSLCMQMVPRTSQYAALHPTNCKSWCHPSQSYMPRAGIRPDALCAVMKNRTLFPPRTNSLVGTT